MAIDFSGGWNGNEVSLQTYYTGNVVLYGSVTYIVQNNVDSVPIGSPSPPSDMSNWDVFVPSASGTSGTSGSSGTTGTSGTSGISGSTYLTTTTNTVLLTPGQQYLVLQPNLAYSTGQQILIYYDSNNYIEALVISYDSITGELYFQTTKVVGSGVKSPLTVNLIGSSGTSGTSGSNGSNGTSGASASIPGWTSAGTINSVGWIATTTNPTIGLAEWDNLSYRQLGSKEWEIVMSFNNTGSGGGAANAGNGDYLFKLPNSLSFDTTLAWQKICTFSVLTSDPNLGKFIIPSGTGMMTDGGGSTTTNLTPIIWNSNYFRILAYIPGGAIKCMGSNYFHTTSTVGFSLNFTFTSV
jgi:hypothetical protein